MTIQLNPTVSDFFEQKTLSDLRARIMKLLRIGNPLSTDENKWTLQQMRNLMNQRLGLALALTSNFRQLGTGQPAAGDPGILYDVYCACGFAGMATHPPGIDVLLMDFINEAQQVLFTRIEMDKGSAARPPRLANNTDATVLDGVPVTSLSIALAKAYFEQPDAQVYFAQTEKYLADQLQRQPPAVTSAINAALIDAHHTAMRRFEVDQDDNLGSETFGQAMVASGDYTSSVSDNDFTNMDAQPVLLLAMANLKKKIGQPDADQILAEYQTYMSDLMKRCPAGAVDCITQSLHDAQDLLYRQYDVFRMERWYTWSLAPGTRFCGIATDDEQSLVAPPVTSVSPGGAAVANHMAVPRFGAGSCVLPDGRIYICGG